LPPRPRFSHASRRARDKSNMGRRKSERPGPSRKSEEPDAGPPGQPKWKLLLLAVIVALLALLFDFSVIDGF
jgi:hypothetical protein